MGPVTRTKTKNLLLLIYVAQLLIIGYLYSRKRGQQNVYNHGMEDNYYSFMTPKKEQFITLSSKRKIESSSLLEKLNSLKINNTVILTSVNYGYLDFFDNLLVSIQKTAPEKLKMVAVIAEDAISRTYLAEHHPNHLLPIAVGKQQNLTGTYFRNNKYKILSRRRPNYLLTVVSTGVNILFTDVDYVWLQDPFLHFDSKFDLIVSPGDRWKNKETDEGLAKGESYVSTCWNNCCAGFFYMKYSKQNLQLLQDWENHLKGSSHHGNQPAFNEVLETGFYSYGVLNPALFPNGKFFFRNHDFYDKRNVTPVVVHASFSGDHDKKKSVFMQYNFWYLNKELKK